MRKANAQSRKFINSITSDKLYNYESKNENESLRYRTNADKNIMAQKSSEVTDNLLSVSRMLASQVTQSEQSLQTLVHSSATVTETQEEFKMMGSVIIQSRKLLTKYGRREVTDKFLIFLALAFFFACVLYVISKRLF